MMCKKLFFKMFAIFLIVLFFVFLSFSTCFAASGKCGDVYWELTDNTLVISGEGKMTNYESGMYTPWYGFRTAIKNIIVGDGVSNIGSCSFYNCTNVTNIQISKTVTKIGHHAFYYTSKLEDVFYEADELSWGALNIENGNSGLKNATIHYVLENEPYIKSSIKVINNSKTIEIIVHNINENCVVIVAGYKGESLVSFEKRPYESYKEMFNIEDNVDIVKVMFWESALSLKPVCKSEIVLI